MSAHRLAVFRSRRARGMVTGDGLVRLSVGCEDPDDLLADLSLALDRILQESPARL